MLRPLPFVYGGNQEANDLVAIGAAEAPYPHCGHPTVAFAVHAIAGIAAVLVKAKFLRTIRAGAAGSRMLDGNAPVSEYS